MEVWKNVKSTTLQDVKRSLNCTDNVNMDVIKRNLTDEMSEKPERNKEKPERNKEKTEENTFTFYWWHPNPAKRGFKNKDDNCYLGRE